MRRALLALLPLLALAAGCANERQPAPVVAPRERTYPLAVRVIADGRRSMRLATDLPPTLHVWVANIAPEQAGLPPAAPEAAPDPATLVQAPEPPRLAVDDQLKPPLLREAVRLVVPAEAGVATVELDVNVDEQGTVARAEWAGGSSDTLLVGLAKRCASAMRFFPAERAGRPVAVWCRQRFDFGAPTGRR